MTRYVGGKGVWRAYLPLSETAVKTASCLRSYSMSHTHMKGRPRETRVWKPQGLQLLIVRTISKRYRGVQWINMHVVEYFILVSLTHVFHNSSNSIANFAKYWQLKYLKCRYVRAYWPWGLQTNLLCWTWKQGLQNTSQHILRNFITKLIILVSLSFQICQICHPDIFIS